MRLSFIFAFITILQTPAGVFSQQVSLNVKETSMREVLKKIETQSNFRFFYNDQLSGLNNTVTLKVDNKSIKEVLDQLLSNQQLSYRMLENNMIVIAPNEIAQQLRVTGTITDATTHDPLIGVSVAVEGTTSGTISDPNGNYGLDVPSADAVLTFTYVGYLPQKVSVGGRNVVDVQMSQDVKSLDAVVVVGYGVQKKRLSTGATLQITNNDIQKQNSVSTMTALQGQTPGVQIVGNSGQPGSGFNVLIRGMGTIGNSAPLFVVDGIPLSSSTGSNTSAINYLNPADIESVDILKDAASAAIYGSRGANGVILITTKKGKAGKPVLTYDGYFGYQNLYKKADLLNAQEYAVIMNEAEINSGLPPTDFSGMSNGQPLVPGWADIASGKSHGTNWLDLMTVKDAPQQNHSFNLTGGNDRSTYSMGLSYTKQEGILGKPVAPTYQRYTFRLNSDHSVLRSRNADLLRIGENISYSYNQNGGLQITGIYSNDIHNALVTTPFLPNLDSTGHYHYAIPWNASASNSQNPIGQMVTRSGGENITKNHQVVGNLYAELQPLRNLRYRSTFGINVSGSSYRRYIDAFNLSPQVTQNYNIVTQNMSLVYSWVFTNTLNYTFNLLDKHHFDVLVGTEAQNGNLGESINAQNVNSSFNDLQYAYLVNSQSIDASRTTLAGGPGTSTQVNNINTYSGENPILSYFGRINYDYRETYLLTLVLREDGSSNFASGHRWGTFPSISGGWVISNEKFMGEAAGWLQSLKIRASWGQNGNQNILPFQYLSTIAFTNANYVFGTNKNQQTIGAYPNILPNPNVKWETSEQTDIGLDARFLKGRLNLTFDWFKKLTKDWLLQAPVLETFGAAAPFVNGGDIQNKGYEVALSWTDNIGDLRYTVSGNVSYNKNKVTKIANNEGIIHGPANVISQGTQEMYRAQVGYPVGYFYGLKTAGVFQNINDVLNYKDPASGNLLEPTAVPGDIRYVDINHDGVIDQNDATMIGNPNPEYTYGINLTLGYKAFDFSLLATGVQGVDIVKDYRSFYDSWQQNYTTDIFGRWHGEGTSNRLPRVVAGPSINTQYVSDLYVENGSYLRISTVTLGYDFKKLFKKIPLGQARLYFQIQNLYTFTNYTGMDPAVGFIPNASTGYTGFSSNIDVGFYPNPRVVLVGADITF